MDEVILCLRREVTMVVVGMCCFLFLTYVRAYVNLLYRVGFVWYLIAVRLQGLEVLDLRRFGLGFAGLVCAL